VTKIKSTQPLLSLFPPASGPYEPPCFFFFGLLLPPPAIIGRRPPAIRRRPVETPERFRRWAVAGAPTVASASPFSFPCFYSVWAGYCRLLLAPATALLPALIPADRRHCCHPTTTHHRSRHQPPAPCRIHHCWRYKLYVSIDKFGHEILSFLQ